MYKLFNCRLFDHQIQQKQTTKTGASVVLLKIHAI